MQATAEFDRQLSRAKWNGIAAGGALVVFLTPGIAGSEIVALFAFALLIACGAQFLFYGGTAVSMKLEGDRRRRFEIGAAIALPLLLVAWNLQGVPLEDLSGRIAGRLGPWTAAGLILWAAVGWASAGFFPAVHRIRGYLVLIGVLFLLSWLRLFGALPVAGGPVGAEEMLFFLLWSAAAQGAAFTRFEVTGK